MDAEYDREEPAESAEEEPAESAEEEPAESAEEAPAEPPPKEAEMKMPESPKMAADDIAVEEPDVGASWKDGLSWQLLASAFYRISGYTGDGVRAGEYNSLVDSDAGYPYPYVNVQWLRPGFCRW